MNLPKKKLIKIFLFVFLLQTFFLSVPFVFAATNEYCRTGFFDSGCYPTLTECEGDTGSFQCTFNGTIIETEQQRQEAAQQASQQTTQQTGPKGYTLLADIPTVLVKTNPSLPEYMKGIVVTVIGLAMVLAVLMIVIGGIQYIVAQTPFALGDAKKRIGGALLGLILALLSYLILQVINPELLNIGLNLKTVVFDPYTLATISEQSASVPKKQNTVCIVQKDCTEYCDYPSTTSEDPAGECSAKQSTYSYPECSSGSEEKPCVSHSCTSTGGSSVPKGCGGGNGKCQPLTMGLCSVENLSSFFGDSAETASIVCNYESGGNPLRPSGADYCKTTGEVFSWGLFQINTTTEDLNGLTCAYKTHPKQSPYTAQNSACTVRNPELYGKCISAAKTARTNLDYAVKLWKSRGWQPWKNTADHCGINY